MQAVLRNGNQIANASVRKCECARCVNGVQDGSVNVNVSVSVNVNVSVSVCVSVSVSAGCLREGAGRGY